MKLRKIIIKFVTYYKLHVMEHRVCMEYKNKLIEGRSEKLNLNIILKQK